MALEVGLAACGVCLVFFGSMFVPVKSIDTGDGIFVQWLMSLAILIVGFFTFWLQSFPGFYPLAMLGGAFWTIGNATAIPIMHRIGMAMGMLIWNTANCIMGWAGGRFGLFGSKANIPESPALNYLGLCCVIMGGILYSRVKSSPAEPTESKKTAVRRNSVKLENLEKDEAEKQALNVDSDTDEVPEVKIVESPKVYSEKQKIGGILLSLVAGIFYGNTFAPVNYMIDNPDKYPGYPTDGLSYVFSHYFGIFLTATTIFVVYAIVKKNRPYVKPECCLPALCCGLFWGIAQSAFFVANQHLSQTITFPIIGMLPGTVAAAWSIFYFKEIRGRRNLIILGIAICFTVTGAALVAISKGSDPSEQINDELTNATIRM